MQDPLDILNSLSSEDLQSTDTSFPNLAPGTYEFRITAAELKDNNAGTGKYLLFQTKLESTDATATNGEPLAPGDRKSVV
jgi:hypothetical protein